MLGNPDGWLVGTVDRSIEGRIDCDGLEVGACDGSVLTVGLADGRKEGAADREGDSVGCTVKLGL